MKRERAELDANPVVRCAPRSSLDALVVRERCACLSRLLIRGKSGTIITIQRNGFRSLWGSDASARKIRVGFDY